MISYIMYKLSDDGFLTFMGFIFLTLWVDLLLLSIIFNLFQERLIFINLIFIGHTSS